MPQDLAEIDFAENAAVDVAQLNALYGLIGWDRANRRTAAETAMMLELSAYRITAHSSDGKLVGFTRICGDPYVVQVLDVITHPDFRRRGIATRCMQGVLAHLQASSYVSVTLISDGILETFYQQWGFRTQQAVTMAWRSLCLFLEAYCAAFVRTGTCQDSCPLTTCGSTALFILKRAMETTRPFPGSE